MKKLVLLSAIIGVSALLSGCGGGSKNGSTTVVVTPGSPSDPKAKFGAAFTTAFSADPNAPPKQVAAGDVPPPDPTATPTVLH